MHPLTTWLALAGSVWTLFAFAEDHLPPAVRADVTVWLHGQTADWAGTLGAVWDSVFDPTDRTGTRGRRACVAAHITAFLGLCLSGVLYPGTSGVMLLVLFLYAPLLLSLLALVNLLPGYVALRVQRRLLQSIIQYPLPGRVLFWLLVTSLGTLGLGLLAWVLSVLAVHLAGKLHLFRYPVTWISGYVEFVLKGGRGSLSALGEAARLQPILVPGIAFPSFGIWLYTPCFPLLWGWLYVLSGALLRLATGWGLLCHTGGTPGLCDIATRPLHTLGAVAVGLVSLVYWAAIALSR